MATFVVTFIKNTAKNNLIASLVKKQTGKLVARPLLYRAWCGTDLVVGEEIEASDSDFQAEVLDGENGPVTIHWFNPA